MRIICAALALLAAPLLFAAEPLSTDRPDFTEGATTVGNGRLQVEAGVTFSDADAADLATFGEVLVRYGWSDLLELRFVLPSYQRLEVGTQTFTGLGDSGLGVKFEFGDVFGGPVATIVGTSVPTSNGDFESSSWQPDFLLAGAWDLGGGYSFGANVGFTYGKVDDDREGLFRVSGAVSIPIASRTAAFVELYSIEDGAGSSDLYGDTGLTYLLSDDLQLDLRVGYGFSDAPIDYFFGAGISRRW